MLNDLNVLNLFPFLASLLDGYFIEMEQASGVVPFEISDEEFDLLFVSLMDGIYPSFARFMCGNLMPVTEHEKSTPNGKKQKGKTLSMFLMCCKENFSADGTGT
jgi:hypothetical protein